MKATSLFGGVQVINILISIIRSKFIAILLGPAGMGIMGLITSATSLIGNLTNFGLGTSAVKDIAAANNTGDSHRISIIVSVFRRLVWITGLLGTIVTLILSSWLSQITFGNRAYTIAFVWVSITLLLTQLNSGQLVVLQGIRKLEQLAKANIFGSALGLIISIPLYYIYGNNGIVPGILVTSFVSLLISWYYSRRIFIDTIKISHSQTYSEGKNMLRMGFLISLSGLLTVGTSYIVRIFISNYAGLIQVGLYTAGFSIINTYVGMIFNAMGTDYYPRLAAVANNNELCKENINQQAEIAILIIAPILIIFLLFINWVIIMLYSKQFIEVNSMIYWAALGMFFKAASWTIGFVLLAKGEGKLFFLSELIANIYILLFNILGFKYFGLTGLGLSFLISYILVLVQIYIICYKKFDFSFHIEFTKIFTFQLFLAISTFLVLKFLPQPYPYLIGLILIGISTWYSVMELDKRLGLKLIISRYFKN